ncbi:MAG: molybdopterin-dependent oxidoreductase [Coriobacteriaceae bacterium]|nr:molybdopterin-dependent oxidoreductase [Coriobacteriaceae bacterium]
MEKQTLTRRTFVELATLTSAVAAFGVSFGSKLEEREQAYAASAPERQVYTTVCHGCIQVCPCKVYVEDGVVVKLEGHPDAPINKGGMCLKGLGQLQTMYSPRRVIHPLKRAGERGTNEWEVISWDEAIQLGGEQFATAIEKYGPYSLWGASGGGGLYASEIATGMQYTFGCAVEACTGALQCYCPRSSIAALMWSGWNQSMADSACLEPLNEYNPTMEVLVEWGAQPAVSQTAQSGRGVADARSDRGLKTIVIDPNMSPDAVKADVWLPVRPGSDTAMELGWLRYIMDKKLYDEDFCKYWTNLPFLINTETKLPIEAEEIWPDYVNPCIDPNEVYDTPAYVCWDNLTGTYQPFPFSAPEDAQVDPELFKEVKIPELGVKAKTAGQIYWEEAEPWTLEHTAEITNVPADLIEEALELYTGAEHAGIAHGVFSDMMQINGEVPLGCLAIDFMMGHANQPGATLTNRGEESLSTSRPTGPYKLLVISYQLERWWFGISWTIGWTKKQNDKNIKEQLKELGKHNDHPEQRRDQMAQAIKDRLGVVHHKAAQYWEQTGPGMIREAVETGEPYRPRLLYEVSGNKMAMIANATQWGKAMRENLDFAIQQYPMITSETIEYIDLFYPTVEWLEYNNGINLTVQCNTQWLRRSVVHIGETVHPEQAYTLTVNKCCDILGGYDKILSHDFVYVLGMFDNYDEKKAEWAAVYGAPSWDELINNQDKYSPLVTPPEEFWYYYQHENIVDDGLPAGFGTESRKIEVYCSANIKMARTGFPYVYPYDLDPCDDYPAICQYLENEENALTDTEYPLTFTSGRVHYWHHGTMRHCAFNRELLPAPDCRINPETAKKYGIEHGDWVKITSRRGSTHGRAYVTKGVAPDTVFQERFWNPECYDDTQRDPSNGWEECNVNVLTPDTARSRMYGGSTYRGFQVKIEKSERPPRIWVEPEEFEPFMPTLQNEPLTNEDEVLPNA